MTLYYRAHRPRVLGEGEWNSDTVRTNPTNGTVLVDTGALSAGVYLVGVVGYGGVAWVYDFQHRNAANDGNVDAQRRAPGAGNEDFPLPNKIEVAAGERFRAVLVGNITGDVQMSIFTLEVE